MRTLIKNAKIVDQGLISEGSILIENGKVNKVGFFEEEKADKVFDANGLYASAGFVDSHTHGAGGFDFMDGTPEAYVTACRTHLTHGTTTILPTTLAASTPEIIRSIKAYQEAKDEIAKTQYVPGLHLEGPYFAMNQKGGQDPRYIKDPDVEEYKNIVEIAKGDIRRWSIAPERQGAMEMGDYLVANGIIPTIAHTDATYDVVVEGLKHGYHHVTHLYSCTSTITRKSGFRILGVTEAAYCLDALTAELIADGCHLPPELIKMIVKNKGVDKLSLITDSLRVAGLNVKTCRIGSGDDGRDCIIEDGVVKLPDRSAFAGSMATTDRLVRTVWKKAGIRLEDVIRMMCENPAKQMKCSDRKGTLEIGKDGDVVIFDDDVNVKAVFYMGDKVV